MTRIIKWGIIGPGNIAHKFVKGLAQDENSELYAIASRSKEKSKAFADQYGAKFSFDNYDDIIFDPSVDILYIATPHNHHFEVAKKALKNKKAVLCEKPITVNSEQLSQLINISKENDTFLMEAMWTKCFPAMQMLKKLLEKKSLGEIKYIEGNFNVHMKNRDPKSRILDLNLAGGALLDIGVYPVSIAHFFLGNPSSIESSVVIGDTGVDEENEIKLIYSQANAVLQSSINNPKDNDMIIETEKAKIVIHAPFWQPTKITIEGEKTEIIDFSLDANGYEYEAREASKCLLNNQKESSIVPLKSSLEVMKILDQCRKQWGLKYPEES